jgi:adenosine deaminase
MTAVTPDWIQGLPKAELHVHLDGSLRPETLLELAHARGVKLPAADPQGVARAMRADDAADLPAYLARFETTLSVLQDTEALVRVTRELVEDHVAEGARLVEIRYAPILNTRGGLSMDQVVEATVQGMEEGLAQARAEGRGPVHAGLILCGIRNLPPETSEAQAELAVRWKGRGVVGFDLAGAEAGHPARRHARAFEIARKGLLPTTVHAGEGWGPESIRDALLSGRAHRVGHGTRLGEDAELEAWFRDRQLPVEVCITSNVQTRVVAKAEEHPVRRYFDLGIPVVLCTDNRLVSGTTLSQEYALAHEALGFTAGELTRVAAHGFRASFLPLEVREAHLAALERWVAETAGEPPGGKGPTSLG